METSLRNQRKKADMARTGSDTLTDREAQLMEVLWSHGEATAEQIRELLPDRPHDSTVRTVLRILEEKGYVARQGPGRPLRYKAIVSRSKAQRTALRRLLGRLFGGSPQALALRLLEDRHLTPAQFEEIARSAASSSSASRPDPSSASKAAQHKPGASTEGGRP
jgi:BlaI family transcriptional regulator, penicillinase repressor